MTQIVEDSEFAGVNLYSRCEIWVLNELGIQAATGNTFVVTYSGTPSSFSTAHAAATFQNVDQTASTLDSASNTSKDQATITTPAFTIAQGGMGVSGAVHGSGGSYDDNGWGAGWVEGTDQAPGEMTLGSSNTAVAYIADGTDNATATHSPATNRHVIVAASLNPSAPICVVTTTADSGAGSLRACIDYANLNPGTTISFNIPGPGNQSAGADSWWRISLVSALPTVTAAGTIIDGTTQTTNQGDTNSQGPEIEISGSGAGNVDGFVLESSNSVIRDLI
ncbi:MAG: hypothetical protein OEM19_04375, partial [Deltaproteobacteria bacterium]|nr:hypothetical protein [Deltaproteobacteria bacterium]